MQRLDNQHFTPYYEGMGKRVFPIIRKEKFIPSTALALFFEVHRDTMSRYLKEQGVDLKNVFSILQFVRDYDKNYGGDKRRSKKIVAKKKES